MLKLFVCLLDMTFKVQIDSLSIASSIFWMSYIWNLNILQFLREWQLSFLATYPFKQREQKMLDFSDLWVFFQVFKFENVLFEIFNRHLVYIWNLSYCLCLEHKVFVKSVDNVKSLFNLELYLNELMRINKSWDIISNFFFYFPNSTFRASFVLFYFPLGKSKYLFSEGRDYYYCFEIFRQQNRSKSRNFEFVVFKSVIVMDAVFYILLKWRCLFEYVFDKLLLRNLVKSRLALKESRILVICISYLIGIKPLSLHNLSKQSH